MPLQVKQVAQFPTNHLLPRTLVDIANKKDTKKEVFFLLSDGTNQNKIPPLLSMRVLYGRKNTSNILPNTLNTQRVNSEYG